MRLISLTFVLAITAMSAYCQNDLNDMIENNSSIFSKMTNYNLSKSLTKEVVPYINFDIEESKLSQIGKTKDTVSRIFSLKDRFYDFYGQLYTKVYPNPKISVLNSQKALKNVKVIPHSSTLRSYVSYVGNQMDVYSCSAWAIASLISITDNFRAQRTFNRQNRNDKDNFISASWIYSQAKARLNDSNCDAGIDLLEAFNVVKEYGTTTFRDVPYYRTKFQCPGELLQNQNTNVQSRRDFVPCHVKPNPIVFQYFLSKKVPLVMELAIDESFINDGFDSYNEKTPYVWTHYDVENPKLEMKPHAVICIGYNDNIGAFEFLNSFGKGFGDEGFFYIDYNFLFKCILTSYYLNDITNAKLLNNEVDESSALKLINNITQKSNLTFYGKGQKGVFDIIVECLNIDYQENAIQLRITNNRGKILSEIFPMISGSVFSLEDSNKKYYFALNQKSAPSKNAKSSIWPKPSSINIEVACTKNDSATK